MEPKDLKSYILFIAISIMFIVMVIMSIIVFVKYKNVPELSSQEHEESFEINLPVIEWSKYENLSKKLPNGNIEQNNK